MTRDHGRRCGYRLLERLEQILILTREADMHDDRQAETKGLPVDACLVTFDDSPLLERADAPGNCRRRKRNALGKLDLAKPAILKQRIENRAIERVELRLFHFSAQQRHLVQIFCAIIFCTAEKANNLTARRGILHLKEGIQERRVPCASGFRLKSRAMSS